MSKQASTEFKARRTRVLKQLTHLRTLVKSGVSPAEARWGHAADLAHVEEILGEAIAFLRNWEKE